jgi:hypothetical protein
MLLVSCGAEHLDDAVTADLLPVGFASAGLERTSDVRTFPDSSLWEYINGDAEIYLEYGVRDVATADYGAGDLELIVDLYCFSEEIGAYGLYTSIRPDHAEMLAIGIAGFASESTLDFVRGPYVVRLTAYSASDQTVAVMQATANELASALHGTLDRPVAFALFPEAYQQPASDRVYARSFLGRAFLSDVYTQTYILGADTVVLFWAHDPDTVKFHRWSEERSHATPEVEAPDLPFDLHSALWVPESFYGPIAAGALHGRLLGMLNYGPQHRAFLVDWLESIPEPPQ